VNIDLTVMTLQTFETTQQSLQIINYSVCVSSFCFTLHVYSGFV